MFEKFILNAGDAVLWYETAREGLPMLVVGVSDDVYHSSKCPFISAHGLMDIKKSPAHFIATRIKPPKEDTPARRFGKIAHSAILEPERFHSNFKILPDLSEIKGTGSTAKKKEVVDDFMESVGPHHILLEDEEEKEKLFAMVDSCYAHPRARQLLFAKGVSEVVAIWTDPLSGEVCKAKIDKLRVDKMIGDYKTTTDASPGKFFWDASEYQYHMQAGHYLMGAEVIFKESNLENFFFIAQEKEPPYAVTAHIGDEIFIRKGKAQCRKAIKTYSDCVKNQSWPSYPTEIFNLSLTTRAQNEED